MSTCEAAAVPGAVAAADAADAIVPPVAAAASAAVSTVLREVDLVMGETPGHERNGAAGAGQWGNYRGSRHRSASDSACAAGPILVCSTGVACGCSGRARRLGG
ncbi:hypothetical protein GCM10010447_04260 [Streptomyces fulvorobeus]